MNEFKICDWERKRERERDETKKEGSIILVLNTFLYFFFPRILNSSNFKITFIVNDYIWKKKPASK